MISQMPYILSFVFIFLIVGAAWYVLDHRYGTGVYRWWYDLTHEHPLSSDVQRGFIFGQPARNRFQSAVVLSLVQSVSAVLLSDTELAAEFFTFLFEVPALMIGFYLGPRLDSLWRRKEQVFETMDKLESGATTVSDEIKGVSQIAVKVVKDAMDWENDSLESSDNSPIADKPKPESESTTKSDSTVDSGELDEPSEDPKELMSSYLRRGDKERGE